MIIECYYVITGLLHKIEIYVSYFNCYFLHKSKRSRYNIFYVLVCMHFCYLEVQGNIINISDDASSIILEILFVSEICISSFSVLQNKCPEVCKFTVYFYFFRRNSLSLFRFFTIFWKTTAFTDNTQSHQNIHSSLDRRILKIILLNLEYW